MKARHNKSPKINLFSVFSNFLFMVLLLYLPMVSRTLIRLIDQAIVPAILLLCTRLMSVVLVSYFIGANFIFSANGFVFSDTSNYIIVNSYSTLAMVVVLAAGLIYILLKAFLFHDTHVSPKLTVKLFQHRMATLIQSSFELYSQGVIWLVYLYLISIVSIILGIFGVIYTWVSISSLVICGLATLLLVMDIENELDTLEDDYREEISPTSEKEVKDES